MSSDSEEESQGFLDRANLNDFSVLFDEKEDDIPLAHYIPAFKTDSVPASRSGKIRRPNKMWTSSDTLNEHHSYLPLCSDQVNGKAGSHMNTFFKYFPGSFFETMAFARNCHYQKATNKSLLASVSELAVFFGISIVMSNLKFPRLQMFWSKKF
jgi:hypothetical protein